MTWSALNWTIWSAGFCAAGEAGGGACAAAAAVAAGRSASIGSADHHTNLVRNAALPTLMSDEYDPAYCTGSARRQLGGQPQLCQCAACILKLAPNVRD